MLSVLAAGLLTVVTTFSADMILALTKLGVPQWFAFMMTLSFRFLPATIEQGKRITTAQQLRGVSGKGLGGAYRRFRFLMIPLLTATLRDARQIALAAEARAYSPARLPAKELKFTVKDWLITAAITSGTIVVLVFTWYSFEG